MGFKGLGSWVSLWKSGSRGMPPHTQETGGVDFKTTIERLPWKAARRTSSQLWVGHSFLDETYMDMLMHLTTSKRRAYIC